VDLRDLDAGHGVRRAAGGALDLEAAPEPDEIAGRAHVLGGHSRGVARGEQKGNRTTKGQKAGEPLRGGFSRKLRELRW